jgi:uncharacterized NAD(P)/FAD-binding protein YdhS
MQPKTTLAIIGGGLSGAAVAYHLAGNVDLSEVDLVVIEPRAELGRGLAYSTDDPDHRLNVPATKMSLRTDQMDHFSRWLQSHVTLTPDSITPAGEVFAPRQVFGRYVAAQMKPLIEQGRLRHVQAWVAGVDKGQRYLLTLSDGTTLEADILVLAATHPKASLPQELAALHQDPALIADPYVPGALDVIAVQERILIVGNGLTSADVTATLHRQGHLGPITALSRHGWRSMPHGPKQAETLADFASMPSRTALGLFQRVRRALADDAKLGLTWHAVLDRVRAQAPIIWAHLPHHERRRFLRHLRALWDIHRFRIAPQTHQINLRMQQQGRLTHLAARIQRVKTDSIVHLTLRARHGLVRFPLQVDRVILATGPAHGAVITSSTFLSDLADLRLLQADPLGLGLFTAPNGHAIPASGTPDGTILVAGPLARGTVGELMGVPEVIAWAEHIAGEAARQIRGLRARMAAE